jgi:hypothetical protein
MSFIESVAEGLCAVLDAYPELAENLSWRQRERRLKRSQWNIQRQIELN